MDTHCHLDDSRFDKHRSLIIREAFNNGIKKIIVPSVSVHNFENVSSLPINQGLFYTLGIHPMSVNQKNFNDDLLVLYNYVKDSKNSHANFIGIGEIGLDFYCSVDDHDIDLQKKVFIEQLHIAEEFSLPVILHARKSHDVMLKILRSRKRICGGIVHAFNGSYQQADCFIKLGFLLGIGGSITYQKYSKIRQNALDIPLENLVLETDSPYMEPFWKSSYDWNINSPCELFKIAIELANIKRCNVDKVIRYTTENILRTIPQMAS
ncbi:deoxyribonuclease [Candidatus Kinetoplastibacterium crithidii (ex Angomonas deanei ATCC 30255)]|nr:deoxyribonuclease [Candidatus Kinetoplastibacterium crithidii (ex Angomonas deanei ATCC 30255)]